MIAPATDGELLAVLLALAGPRQGDPVCVQAPNHPLAARLRRGLLAMTGTDSEVADGARVTIAGGSPDLPEAVRRTAPGGRLVSLAVDERTVAEDVASYGLVVLHVEALDTGQLAWVARLTPGRATRS